MLEAEAVEYITTGQAAELLECTPQNVWLLIQAGRLRSIKVGNRYLTTREWVLEMLENPPTAICKGCGNPFVKNSGKQLFCNPQCRQRYYGRRRKEKRLSPTGED